MWRVALDKSEGVVVLLAVRQRAAPSFALWAKGGKERLEVWYRVLRSSAKPPTFDEPSGCRELQFAHQASDLFSGLFEVRKLGDKRNVPAFSPNLSDKGEAVLAGTS